MQRQFALVAALFGPAVLGCSVDPPAAPSPVANDTDDTASTEPPTPAPAPARAGPRPNLVGRRLGCIGYKGSIGWERSADEEAKIARFRLYFDGLYTENASALTAAKIAAIKAIHPETIVLLYGLPYEIQPAGTRTSTHPMWREQQAMVIANDWWLRTTSDAFVAWTDRYDANNVNLTGGNRQSKDANGERYPEAIARLYQRHIGAARGADGVFWDNWSLLRQGDELVGNVDFLLDGVGRTSRDTAVSKAFHASARRAMDSFDTLDGGKRLHVGNMLGPGDNPFDPTISGNALAQRMSGALMEYAWGPSYSLDRQRNGFLRILDHARRSEAATIGPKLVMLNQEVHGITDLAMMRYGLATTLLQRHTLYGNRVDDGGPDANFRLYDEYLAPLGDLVGDEPIAPAEDGIWRADYEGGIVLVDPTNNKGAIFENTTIRRTNGVVTITGTTHALASGAMIRVSGTPSLLAFNTPAPVSVTVVDPRTFAYPSPGPDGSATAQYGYIGRGSTIHLPPGFRRIGAPSDPKAGDVIQAPSVNDGGPATTVTMFAPDGLILVREP